MTDLSIHVKILHIECSKCGGNVIKMSNSNDRKWKLYFKDQVSKAILETFQPVNTQAHLGSNSHFSSFPNILQSYILLAKIPLRFTLLSQPLELQGIMAGAMELQRDYQGVRDLKHPCASESQYKWEIQS